MSEKGLAYKVKDLTGWRGVTALYELHPPLPMALPTEEEEELNLAQAEIGHILVNTVEEDEATIWLADKEGNLLTHLEGVKLDTLHEVANYGIDGFIYKTFVLSSHKRILQKIGYTLTSMPPKEELHSLRSIELE